MKYVSNIQFSGEIMVKFVAATCSDTSISTQIATKTRDKTCFLLQNVHFIEMKCRSYIEFLLGTHFQCKDLTNFPLPCANKAV